MSTLRPLQPADATTVPAPTCAGRTTAAATAPCPGGERACALRPRERAPRASTAVGLSEIVETRAFSAERRSVETRRLTGDRAAARIPAQCWISSSIPEAHA